MYYTRQPVKCTVCPSAAAEVPDRRRIMVLCSADVRRRPGSDQNVIYRELPQLQDFHVPETAAVFCYYSYNGKLGPALKAGHIKCQGKNDTDMC